MSTKGWKFTDNDRLERANELLPLEDRINFCEDTWADALDALMDRLEVTSRGQFWTDTTTDPGVLKVFCCGAWHERRAGDRIVCGKCSEQWPIPRDARY